jgi:hypothetical protein
MTQVNQPSGLKHIFESHGTDKGGYASAYEAFLAPRRQTVTKVLEVGIGTLIPNVHSSMLGWAAAHYQPGGSLRSWRDYFPNARIIGLDVQPDTQFSAERIETQLCDSSDRKAVQALASRFDLRGCDLIIDDGSHRADDQLKTLANLFSYLSAGGVYVIEDVIGNGLSDQRGAIDEITSGAAVFFFCDRRFGFDFNPIFIVKAAAA